MLQDWWKTLMALMHMMNAKIFYQYKIKQSHETHKALSVVRLESWFMFGAMEYT